VGAAGLASVVIAPLAAYVFMIALFGLPHVLCELRFCDERFSGRAPRSALVLVGALLVVIAAARITQGAGLLPTSVAVPVELVLGVGLAAAGVSFMQERRLLGLAAGLSLAFGAALAPITTFLTFAWLHNLTPLAFVAEILPRGERRQALLLLSIPFFLLPGIVATGVLQGALHEALGYSGEAAPSAFGAGRYPLTAFLLPTLSFADALPLFSAAVAAQAMHYLAVIAVLPRLLARYGRGGSSSLAPWPSWPRFYWAIGALALLVFVFHAADYPNARALYGVAAAIHSWVELPIFLIALGAGFRAANKGARP
jgi:hypothetical protein